MYLKTRTQEQANDIVQKLNEWIPKDKHHLKSTEEEGDAVLEIGDKSVMYTWNTWHMADFNLLRNELKSLGAIKVVILSQEDINSIECLQNYTRKKVEG